MVAAGLRGSWGGGVLEGPEELLNGALLVCDWEALPALWGPAGSTACAAVCCCRGPGVGPAIIAPKSWKLK